MLIYTLRRINLLLCTLLLLSMVSYCVYRQSTEPQNGWFAGYYTYVIKLFSGDLGTSSLSGKPVVEMIAHHLPATLELCLSAIIIALIVGVTLGTVAAFRLGRLTDWLISGVSIICAAIPVYWLALLLILIFSMLLGIFPSSGQINLLYEIEPVTGFTLIDSLLSSDNHDLSAFYNALQHLLLPASALALLPTTEVIRLVRSSMGEVLRQNYIKAAFSRGLSPWSVLRRHALRNAIPPILPTISMQFNTIMTSAIIIEMIFEWPGLGRWLMSSIAGRDYVAIQAGLLTISAMLIAINIGTELFTNLLYPVKRKELYGQQG
jgi:cationic peptide transport system permease protein